MIAHALQAAAIVPFLIGGSVAFGALADVVVNHADRVGAALTGRTF